MTTYVIWSKRHGIYETRPDRLEAADRAIELAGVHVGERFHIFQSFGWARCAAPGGAVLSRGLPRFAKAGPQS